MQLSSDIAGMPDITGFNDAVSLWLGRSSGERIPDRNSQDAWDLPPIQLANRFIIKAAVDDFDRARIRLCRQCQVIGYMRSLP